MHRCETWTCTGFACNPNLEQQKRNQHLRLPPRFYHFTAEVDSLDSFHEEDKGLLLLMHMFDLVFGVEIWLNPKP